MSMMHAVVRGNFVVIVGRRSRVIEARKRGMLRSVGDDSLPEVLRVAGKHFRRLHDAIHAIPLDLAAKTLYSPGVVLGMSFAHITRSVRES
ncbi:hypothetical protein BCD48_37805 [Pseudofrankia sp. BMG5.36]|nr:hypothetical protein BCD48_37805 [Pseudofrankia sp. BMG5.36]